MVWSLFIPKMLVVLVCAITSQIFIARQDRKRIARLEAIRGDWHRETHWVGVVVRALEPGAPGTAFYEMWNDVYGGQVRKGGLS
jgi:Mg2+/citrate symporter